MRTFRSMGLEVVRLTDTGQIRQLYVPETHKLYEAVVSRSAHKLEILPLEFFHELSRRFPGQISCTFVLREDQVVAFNWAL